MGPPSRGLFQCFVCSSNKQKWFINSWVRDILISEAKMFALATHISQFKLHNLASQESISSKTSFAFVHFRFSKGVTFRNKSPRILKLIAKDSLKPKNATFTDVSFYWEDQEQEEDIEDVGSPWEGAIIYKRNPSISHIEYCTTLERLGLGKLSTETSKSRASVMGLRVTKAVKDYPLGTPVQVSIDVTRKKQKLRLDGIVKTVITLGCNRYISFSSFSSAVFIFSNTLAFSFSMLLVSFDFAFIIELHFLWSVLIYFILLIPGFDRYLVKNNYS